MSAKSSDSRTLARRRAECADEPRYASHAAATECGNQPLHLTLRTSLHTFRYTFRYTHLRPPSAGAIRAAEAPR